jgi:hypothetical protein
VSVEDVIAAVNDRKQRIDKISLYSDYYDGRHRIGQFATEAFRRLYAWVLENARENYCKPVVRGFSSKLKIQTWESTTQGMAQAASELSDDHGLKRVINLTHRETYKTGDSYVLVWPDEDGMMRAWPKRSGMCAPLVDPGRPDRMRVFATVWVANDGFGRVNLYYPEGCERWRTIAKLRQPSMQQMDATNWPTKPTAWRPYDDDGDPDTIPNPGDTSRVPAVWFPHDADEIGGHGRSILEDVIPLQDGLNKSVADLIVTEEDFAQPLRYLLNYKAKRSINPETGEVETEKIEANPTKRRFLTVPGNGPIGQLDPPDASKLIAVHEAWANKITRVTGLPAFYVTQTSGEPPTGVALRVLSTRLTDLVSETMDDFTPRWQEVQELLGNPDVRPIWKDPAPKDESEELDDAESRKRIGFGFRENLKELGYDEEDITRIETEQKQAAQEAQRAFEARTSIADLTE